MLRTLRLTSALAAVALTASQASAEAPKVTLGGFSDFHVGITSDDQDANTRSQEFVNDNEISVSVDGKTAGGLAYGAVIDLEADTTDDTAGGAGTNAARTFTYLEGGWGRVEMGDVESAAATMRVDASTIAVAAGGIDGAWTYYVNGTVDPDGYVSVPQLPSEHGSADILASLNHYNSTKVNYYTPRFSGLQGGVSYTPALNRGQTVDRADNTALDIENIWNLGLNYEREFGAVRLAAAATYEAGDAETAATEDTSAWNVGGIVGYGDFQVAASYGDWDDSDASAGRESDYWTLGVAYSAGPVGLSATYLESQREVGANDNNDFEHLVLGADYKLADGLTTYAELSLFEFDSGTNANDNEGSTIILGTQVAF